MWVSDNEGGLVAASMRNEDSKISHENSQEDKQGETERFQKIKTSLSLLFPNALEQIGRSEKWKTKNFITMYDTVTVFQSKINKTILVHLLCDSKTFNYEVTKEIVSEIQEKLLKIEKEIDNLTQNNFEAN